MTDDYFSWNTHTKKHKDLTYILGAKCKDGVVLVSDRKVSYRSGLVEFQDKLFQDVEFAITGSSGVAGLYDKFRTRITHAVMKMKAKSKKNNKPIGSHDFIQKVEKIAFDLNSMYRKRDNRLYFDVLMGVKTNRYAVLRYIDPSGVEEPVKSYKAIGSGYLFGESILRTLWHKNITMEEIARCGYFIIKQIETLNLDRAVGVGSGKAQIYYIPDDPHIPIRRATTNELKKAKADINHKFREYRNVLKELFIP